jgi:hypothetical protein
MKVYINIAILAALLAVGVVDAGATRRRRRGVRHLGGKGAVEEEEIPSAPSKPEYDEAMSKGGGGIMSKKEGSGKKEKAPKGKGGAPSEGDDEVSAEHPEEPVVPEHPIACPEVVEGGCLTVDGVNGIMQAFEGAVVAISNVSRKKAEPPPPPKETDCELLLFFCRCCSPARLCE